MRKGSREARGTGRLTGWGGSKRLAITRHKIFAPLYETRNCPTVTATTSSVGEGAAARRVETFLKAPHRSLTLRVGS